jgi:phage terminase large subunit GpA-like protein
VSEWAINYAIFALDRGAEVWANGQKTGLNVGYIFPTQAALSAFSKERISGLKRESAYLEALLGDSDDYDTVDFKQIRDSYLYLRGGWSEAGLLSFAADVAIFDEYDRMEPSAIALARRRLNASTVRREVFISTPTLPGTGVHGLYLQSDRQVYEQWHSCGGWVSYDFWRDVKVDGSCTRSRAGAVGGPGRPS